MTNKIKELTEKIYSEGVEKAKIEAGLIIANSQKEADNIIKAAKNKEKEIVEKAQKQADELKKNTASELQLASRQFISSLKHKINRLITTDLVEKPVKEALENSEFVQKIILTIIENWDPQKPEESDISVLLPQKEEKKLEGFFDKKARQLLDSGLVINFDPGINSGFKIGPKDGSYFISFTQEDFENYFKNYLKDKTKKLIFD